MKKARNGFIKNLPYFCLICVLALGLMTIVGTGGDGGGGGGDTTTTTGDTTTDTDTTPPTISSTSPADGATDAINTAITARFSEAMDSSTITTSTFTISTGGSDISGTVSYDVTTATFAPSSNLGSYTTYTATITTGVKDLAGNSMASDYTWNFTTLDLPPQLAWDFYPNGLTRNHLLERLTDAVQKTGHIPSDETWSGTIHITGDLQVDPDVTLTIEPGTLVLVAARSDDQEGGHEGSIDQHNPMDPPYEANQRTSFGIQGSLIINGTKEEPVIITSNAVNPQNDDWGGFNLGPGPGSRVEITRAIIEFTRTIGIGSSDVVIRQSILRNMMECVVIHEDMCNIDPQTVLALTPTLTQNYIYNGGRHMVTVRTGAPTISHNVIRARPDMDTTGWEQGALATDFPTCAVIHHNYLDGGQPRPYGGEIGGEYHGSTAPHGAVIRGICSLTFEYNTVIGSPLAIESYAGEWSIAHNNIIPVPASGPAAQDSGPTTCLMAGGGQPEGSDQCQFEFLEQIGGAPSVELFSAPNNYWGTSDPDEIERRVMGQVEYQPFETEFIVEALPNWHEFEW